MRISYSLSILFLLSFLNESFLYASKDEVQEVFATTEKGKLRGKVEEGICVWREIKYAQAERFGYPRAVAGWKGTKDALEFGPVAPQLKGMSSSSETQNEDCLYLNIWSPAADSKKRPVMVYIHGGSFIEGSGSTPIYNGLKLAKKGDVVVVTINYRLGSLGFLYFEKTRIGKDTFGNNLGIRDQIAALHWVKENIAAFGGDAAQVTIFGESAGGTSVMTLFACRAAKGLFKGAIAESGPPKLWPPEVADSMTKKYFSFLHLPPDSIRLLKSLPLDTLLAAQKKSFKIYESRNR